MSHEYSENILVQESSINLLREELGWETYHAHNNEILGKDGTLGRESYEDVILPKFFRESMKRLNPWMSENHIIDALRQLKNHLTSASAIQTNEEKYKLIVDGFDVTLTEKNSSGQLKKRTAKFIDFKNPLNNHFLAVSELKIHNRGYHRRADIIGFVNGLPLIFIELKAHNVDVKNAYTDNYKDYQDAIPQLFYYNAFSILSNGAEAKVGTLNSKYAFFHEWKRLKEEETGSVALETALRGLCKKENFIDIFENFILFDHTENKIAKILARNHQYLGVNEAVKSYENRKLSDGKLGVFWHTQGSGKSYSMVFFAKKIRRKFEGSPTFVVITDRDVLDKQICNTFINCNILTGKPSQFTAVDGVDLVERLKSNQSFIFTLIQKFNTKKIEPITPEHDIILMSDEAHRSQYGSLADNMMRMLPTASRIGFTGTPILSFDNITERTFGTYVSIYDFKRAVEDGATVPLYYENRGEKLKNIENPELNDKIIEAIDEYEDEDGIGLDDDQKAKIEKEFKHAEHIMTAEPRLKVIAQDFVNHYTDIWTTGKAMFVCLNKVTCVRMCKMVKGYWQEKIAELEETIKSATQQEAAELERKLVWMKETEMRVVISQEQNEIATFKTWELENEMAEHRNQMEKRELDKEFKDADNPFRIVFVCAMWLTGFDVPSLSCLYLDKPLKAHTLMQAIARANRINEGKSNGLIIDYVGIVQYLKKALADYTNKKGKGEVPTEDKSELIAQLIKAVDAAENILLASGFKLSSIINNKDFKKLGLLDIAKDALLGNDESKKKFCSLVYTASSLKKYCNKGDLNEDLLMRYNAEEAVYRKLLARRAHISIEDLKYEINQILTEYISVNEARENDSGKKIDISSIDFSTLSQKIKHKKTMMREIEEIMKNKIEFLIEANPERTDFYNAYEAIIKAYNENNDFANLEKEWQELMELATKLTEEEKRYIREGFANEAELAVYDILMKGKKITAKNLPIVKDVAKKLLQDIKSKIAELNCWRDKEETRADINLSIRDILWVNLPVDDYNDEDVATCNLGVYKYFYEHNDYIFMPPPTPASTNSAYA